MFQDTLVALDWDGKTAIPYLAKSWTISEDGRTYTFKLRDDVSFCSGKKFTADDVVYTFKRLKDPAIKGPYAWRAGNIKELRATDPYTVEYELEEPFSELLLQLTMFTNVIHNKESVETLGKDYGIKGVDGTGPWCFDHWQPRTEIVLKRHDAYKWGPSMYKNKGPVKFEKLVDQDRAGGFQPRRGDDGRPVRHHPPVPGAVHRRRRKAAPMLTGAGGQAEFPAALLRLQDHPADGGRPPRARGDEHRHQPRRDRQGQSCRQRRSGLHLRRSRGAGLRSRDQGRSSRRISSAAKKLLDEAGWKLGADGIREKDGVKLAPKVYFTARSPTRRRVAEAIQGYLRKIGIDWQLQPWDSTIAAGEDGRTGLRNLDGDGALPLGRRPDEHLFRLRPTSRRRTG